MAALHVVFDLEATCWPSGTSPGRTETIEIGAVKLDGESLEVNGEFSTFVRPTQEPTLSSFCTELTSIRQKDADEAPEFPDALDRFLSWVGSEDAVLCSWGDYDRRQLELDCERHSIPRPALLDAHLNLKRLFADTFSCPCCGMRHALRRLSFEPEGVHHRGIDDARNIARVAQVLLRNAGAEGSQ